MFTRESILSRPTYWVTGARLDFTQLMEYYMEKKHLKRKDLANEWKCSPSYVSQILNGDTNISLEKLYELALKMGKVPFIRYEDLDIVLARDAIMCEDSYDVSDIETDTVHMVRKEPIRRFSVVQSLVEA